MYLRAAMPMNRWGTLLQIKGRTCCVHIPIAVSHPHCKFITSDSFALYTGVLVFILATSLGTSNCFALLMLFVSLLTIVSLRYVAFSISAFFCCLILLTNSRDAFKESLQKDLQYDSTKILAINALNGISELDTLSLSFLGNEILDLPNLFKPLVSANTVSNKESGGQEKSDTEISDEGEASREKRDKAKG